MTTKTIEEYTEHKTNEIISFFPRKQIQVFFDGLCQPVNPGGIACFAFIIKDGTNTIHSGYGLAANDSTNNVAEYTGLIRALEWLLANKYENENIIIKGDSQLVIRQIKKEFKVKATTIIPLYHQVMSLVSKFNHIQFEWIPREQNKEADSLSNYAYTMSYPESHKNEYNNNLENKDEGSKGFRVCGFIIEE